MVKGPDLGITKACVEQMLSIPEGAISLRGPVTGAVIAGLKTKFSKNTEES
jgi:hypothetical protein